MQALALAVVERIDFTSISKNAMVRVAGCAALAGRQRRKAGGMP